MATEVRLPQFGMGMQDGVILEWHKKEGDLVSEGELLLEVEAAKAVMEVVAPASGVLVNIVAHPGATVPVRDVIAIIATGNETVQSATAVPGKEPENQSTSVSLGHRHERLSGHGLARDKSRPQFQVEPRARRLALESGLNVQTVPGSGPGGRITEADVRAILAAAK